MSKYFKIHNFIIYIICEILKILYEVELNIWQSHKIRSKLLANRQKFLQISKIFNLLVLYLFKRCDSLYRWI